MKRKSIVVSVVLLVAIMVALPIFAGARAKRNGVEGRPGVGMMLERLQALGDELDLTAAQREEIRSIARGVLEENKGHRQQMRGGFREAGKILIANPNEVESAKAVLERNDAARAEMRENVIDGLADALRVLTPQQRAKLDAWLDAHPRPSF